MILSFSLLGTFIYKFICKGTLGLLRHDLRYHIIITLQNKYIFRTIGGRVYQNFELKSRCLPYSQPRRGGVNCCARQTFLRIRLQVLPEARRPSSLTVALTVLRIGFKLRQPRWRASMALIETFLEHCPFLLWPYLVHTKVRAA